MGLKIIRANTISKRELIETPATDGGSNFSFTNSNKTPANVVSELIYCNTVSNGNIASLNGSLTINGYTTQDNDTILVKDQTTASENGIYTANSGDWIKQDLLDNSIYRYVIIDGNEAGNEYLLDNIPVSDIDNREYYLTSHKYANSHYYETTLDKTAIDNLDTTPVQLIPAIAGKIILPEIIVMQFGLWTGGSASTGTLGIRSINTTPITLASVPDVDLNGSLSINTYQMINQGVEATGNAIRIDFDGANLVAPPNSFLKITIYYKIIG